MAKDITSRKSWFEVSDYPYPPGRKCKNPDCGQELSRHNPGPLCNQCKLKKDEIKDPRVRKALKREEEKHSFKVRKEK